VWLVFLVRPGAIIHLLITNKMCVGDVPRGLIWT
jgi:hypothetical protein